MTHRVAILDYGCGNLASVANAVRKVGGEVQWMTQHHIPSFTHIILPGQGSFQTGERLSAGQRVNLTVWKDRGVPILGICLGMQLMCEGSEEAPGVEGLGWLPWMVSRLDAAPLPHIGWNSVHGRDYYFCHSYAVRWPWPIGTVAPDWAKGSSYQNDGFVAETRQGNLWAVQFHPEKSGTAGLALLAEFLKL